MMVSTLQKEMMKKKRKKNILRTTGVGANSIKLSMDW